MLVLEIAPILNSGFVLELLVRPLAPLVVNPLEGVVRNLENISRDVVFESSSSLMLDM